MSLSVDTDRNGRDDTEVPGRESDSIAVVCRDRICRPTRESRQQGGLAVPQLIGREQAGDWDGHRYRA